MLLSNSFISTDRMILRSFAMIPDRAFAISSLFLELQRSCIYGKFTRRGIEALQKRKSIMNGKLTEESQNDQYKKF